MKGIIVFLVLGTFCMQALAQDSTKVVYPKFLIGVHGGPGPATLVGGVGEKNQYVDHIGARLGYMSGISFHYQVLQRMALCFELNYEARGYTVLSLYTRDLNDGSSPGPDAAIPWNWKIIYRDNFLTMPILAKFKINKSRKKTEWFVKGGLNTGILVNSSTRYKKEINHHKDDPYLSFALASGFGVNIPMGKNAVFQIEARDHLGLGNIIRYKRNNLLALLIGFGYRF